MAVTKIRKTSSTIFLVSIIISVIVIALFIFGGQVAPEQKLVADKSQPVFTDLMLYWAYILLAVTIVALVVLAAFSFISSLKSSPKSAMGGLIAAIALIVILGLTYAIGSGELLNIPGYEGTDNNPGTLKMTDMWIYSMYVMLGLSIVAILVTPLLSKRK